MEKIALILDADDTLWENNVFYEEATDAFAERMAREGFDPRRARETLDRIERSASPSTATRPRSSPAVWC